MGLPYPLPKTRSRALGRRDRHRRMSVRSPARDGLRPGCTAVGIPWGRGNAYAWVESVRSRRRIAAPFGDIGLPTIDPADIAEVAAAALSEDGHAGQVYELTGPALSTPRHSPKPSATRSASRSDSSSRPGTRPARRC